MIGNWHHRKAFNALIKRLLIRVSENSTLVIVWLQKTAVGVSDGAKILQPSDDLTVKLTNLQLNDVESHDPPEQERLYERPFQEGYDVKDPSYEAWVRINYPGDADSECCNSSSVQSQGILSLPESSSAVQSEVLVLPKPKERIKKRKCKETLNEKSHVHY